MVDKCGFIGTEGAFYHFDIFIATNVILNVWRDHRIPFYTSTPLSWLRPSLVEIDPMVSDEIVCGLGPENRCQFPMKVTRKKIVETEVLLYLQNLGLFHIHIM